MPVYVDISTISSSVDTILEFKRCEKHSLLKAILEVFHVRIQYIVFFVRGNPSQKTIRFLGG